MLESKIKGSPLHGIKEGYDAGYISSVNYFYKMKKTHPGPDKNNWFLVNIGHVIILNIVIYNSYVHSLIYSLN